VELGHLIETVDGLHRDSGKSSRRHRNGSWVVRLVIEIN
jgi:hypothetical protein